MALCTVANASGCVQGGSCELVLGVDISRETDEDTLRKLVSIQYVTIDQSQKRLFVRAITKNKEIILQLLDPEINRVEFWIMVSDSWY